MAAGTLLSLGAFYVDSPSAAKLGQVLGAQFASGLGDPPSTLASGALAAQPAQAKEARLSRTPPSTAAAPSAGGKLGTKPAEESRPGRKEPGVAATTPMAAVAPCSLRICTRFGPEAPRIFVSESVTDLAAGAAAGAGAGALGGALAGMVLASGIGANFGGVCAADAPSPDGSAHAAGRGQLQKALDFLFGSGASAELLRNCSGAEFALAVASAGQLEGNHSGVRNGSSVLVTNPAMGNASAADVPLRSSLMRALAVPFAPAAADMDAWRFTPNAPRVVVCFWHNRHGLRVWPDPPHPIHNLMDRIRAHWPDADFHAWLPPPLDAHGVADPSRTGETVPGEASALDLLWIKGVRVHKNSSAWAAWSQVLRADLVVLASNSTSLFTAALSSGCGIYFGSAAGIPRQGWLSADVAATEGGSAELRACLARAYAMEPPPAEPFCHLPICNRGAADAPRLFVAEHMDGAGHRMKNIVDGMAVAARTRMHFGGVRAHGSLVTDHGHNFRTLVDGFFGEGAADEFFPQPAPNFSAKFEGVKQLIDARPTLANGSLIFLPSSQDWDYDGNVPASTWYSDDLVAALRQPILKRPVLFAPGRPAVALHLRRGDLERGDGRAADNEFYYVLLEHIRLHLPDADVHLWSSIWPVREFNKNGQPGWKDSDFDGFRERGVKVHLDDDSLLEPWTHMIRAHVFVAAASSFAYVPAALNPNCVINFAGFSRPWVGVWLSAQEEMKRPANNSQLRDCIVRAWPAANATRA